MPRNIGSNAGQAKNVKLDLGALGDVAKETVTFGTNDKPVLTKPVLGTMLNADLTRRTELMSNQNDPSKKYFKCILSVNTEFDYEDVLDDGSTKNVTAHCRDNYSGLRYVPKIDDNTGNVVMNAVGEPALERLWLGDGSDCGQLFAKVQAFDKNVQSYSDFFAFFTEERKCIIMTERKNFGNQNYDKEIIQKFITDETYNRILASENPDDEIKKLLA